MKLRAGCIGVVVLGGIAWGVPGAAQSGDPGPYFLDGPAMALQAPYSPNQGETVSVNPPPFIWVPPEENLTYVVDLSRSPDFSGPTKHMAGISISTVGYPNVLEPGEWYWRYGVELESGNVQYSKTRAFTVPEDAVPLPYPDVDVAMGRIPRQRPRMFVPSTRLARYRKRAASGDLREHTGRAFSELDEHIGEELVAEPPYVEGTGAERGKHFAEIIRATRPPMDQMEQFALSYLLTENEAHGLEAKRRLQHFFGWDPEGSTAYKNNDEPAMWIMMRGVRAYDWTRDLFKPAERRQIEKVMRVRAGQFYDHLRNWRQFHTNPYESHAGRTLGFLGEVSIAFAHEWPEAREWFDYVLTMFWNIYPAWGQADGGWHEGPNYYTAYMSFALHYVVAMREATGVDLMQKPFFRNTPYYLLYTNPPYAQRSPFGDGEEHSAATWGKGHVMYWFSSLLHDPYLRWHADQMKSQGGGAVLGLVLHDARLKGKSPADLPPARYFPGVGLVSLHTALGDAANDVHFLIHSDPYGPISHAHADQNAFAIEAYGEALAIASGYYPWYGSDHHRLWQWESKSSNTITINGGIGQVGREPASRGAITAFLPGRDYDYVEADATAAYQGRLTRFVRRVVHVRPGIFVIFDDAAAPEPVTFEWWLHALSEMRMDQQYQQVILAQGDARMYVRLSYGDNLRFAQKSGFEHPPERGGADQFHFTASTPTKTDRLRLVSVLMPYKAGAEDLLPQVEPIASDTGRGVTIEDASGRHTVVFRSAAGAPTWGVGYFECDGDAFALHSKPDSVVDRLLHVNGTRLVQSFPDGTDKGVKLDEPL